MIVLVTGATAGFGECITRRFIQQGHKVIATGRRQERLQELKDELGDNLYIAQLDVRNRAAIEEMLASLPAEWCNIDILVKGFVTFTDQAKMKILSVSQQSLERYSAVSEKVAAEMATGAIERADADVSIAITGYGGPEGGEDGTPAGTVWFAWHIKGQTYTAVMHFAGDCETVLALAVRFALAQLLQLLL